MERVISKLQSAKTWKQELRKTCRRNKLSIQLVNYFTPLRFRQALTRFAEVHEKKGEDRSQRWLQNQLKAFYWFCMALSFAEERVISDFGQEQWKTLHQIFIFKSLMTLKYEAQKLISEIKPQKAWSFQEENIFKEIMQSEQQLTNRWNEKARQLYQLSNGQYLRSGKQCRQKWLNHLDPSKNHGEWNLVEERRFIGLLIEKGRKWSKIARELESNRTEHMVKNRFKTILGRMKRSYPDIKDQDKLLEMFMRNEIQQVLGVSGEVESKQESKEAMKYEIKDEGQISIEMRQEKGQINVEKQRSEEDLQEEEQEHKDKVEVSRFRGTSGLDLAQVYSPWIGMPATPAFSPNMGFFLNMTNFSSFDHVVENNFYSPDKPQL